MGSPRWNWRCFGVLAAALLTASAHAQGTTRRGNVAISVHTLNRDGAPIAGVGVTVANLTARQSERRTSNARGLCTEVYARAGDRLRITPLLEGWSFGQFDSGMALTVSGAQSVYLKATHSERGRSSRPPPAPIPAIPSTQARVAISVHTLNRDGAPIAGVGVTVANGTTRQFERRTSNARGLCTEVYARAGDRLHITPRLEGWSFGQFDSGMALTVDRTQNNIYLKATSSQRGGSARPTPAPIPAIPSDQARISIRITDRGNNPIEDARVEFQALDGPNPAGGVLLSDRQGRLNTFSVRKNSHVRIGTFKQGWDFGDWNLSTIQPAEDTSISIRGVREGVAFTVKTFDRDATPPRGTPQPPLPNVTAKFENLTTGRSIDIDSGPRGVYGPVQISKGDTFRITPSKDGYVFNQESHRFTADRPVNLDFYGGKIETAAKVRIDVQTLDGGGNNLPGVRVVFRNADTGNEGSRVSGRDGVCEPFFVRPGNRYHIYPALQGYHFDAGPAQPVTTTVTRNQSYIFKGNLADTSASGHDYRITLRTSNHQYAATGSRIFVALHGDAGSTGRGLLRPRNRSFERGATDSLTVSLPQIGNIQRITLYSDGTASGGVTLSGASDTVRHPDVGWLPEFLDIEDTRNHLSYRVPCYRWIRSRSEFIFVQDTDSLWDVFDTLAGESLDERIAETTEVREVRSRDWAGPIYGDGAIERTFTAYRLDQTCPYLVSVTTANAPRAGTDAEVYLTIFDQHDRALPTVLLDNTENNFESGKTDRFTLMLPKVDDISKIVIGHNNNPHSSNAEWHVQHVIITRQTNPPRVWWFQIDKMLAADRAGRRDVNATATPVSGAPGRPLPPPADLPPNLPSP